MPGAKWLRGALLESPNRRVSPQYVALWESGSAAPSLSTSLIQVSPLLSQGTSHFPFTVSRAFLLWHACDC